VKTRTQVIRELLDEIWEYSSWVEPMNKLLNGWTSREASEPLRKGIPSVMQIVNHAAFWEEVAARRLNGQPLEDLNKQFDEAHDGLAPASMPAWPQAAENYRKQRSAVVKALERLSDEDLARTVAGEDFTLFWPAVGRAIHDTYHAGQIALLHELVGHELPTPTEPPAGSAKLDAKADLKKFLLELMENSWGGSMWLHSVGSVLTEIPVKLAQWRASEEVHTIAEIAYHMTFWEEFVTRLLRGQPINDEKRKEQAAGPAKQPAGMPTWPEVRDQLIEQHQALRQTMASMKETDLFKALDELPEAYHPLYRLVSGVIAHDSYHLGQIVLLQQMFEEA
jgi:uncharacterized damage-inducible protein DinB